jgi:hypothetical protein
LLKAVILEEINFRVTASDACSGNQLSYNYYTEKRIVIQQVILTRVLLTGGTRLGWLEFEGAKKLCLCGLCFLAVYISTEGDVYIIERQTPMDERQTLIQTIAELEARLANLQQRLPAHSIPPALIAEWDELDEALADARLRLAELNAQNPD